ncbi:DUF1716-domain-containing protein [Zopfia rhizophila CBS 207.26]|uniref:DUF1716-domain-containing protein n=1 Tax=Zopfia rhizophila CBS 207.26 TaxID=1314779 RepID=A0A6A6DIE9_9PEZI|nr:DUF1716-domain-containing protein [Zopfia rhizophila CBS 207.26]
MTSIDDLFKRPSAPTKRKFENPSELDPTQAYKSAKLSSNGDVKRPAHTFVADEHEDDEDEAGPSLPPDIEDDGGDDDEGRFFGGGLDENAKEAMDYLDANDAEESFVEEKFDTVWLRKLASAFERKISKNAELRAKYEDNPSKFMASEGDLDEGIKALSILSEHPEHYEEFVKAGGAASLVSLLAHENTDIAIDAIEIISELTDEDVEAAQEQWDALVTAMLDADLLSLLIDNFSRFDETVDVDRSGVYHSLQVLENLASQPTNLEPIGKKPALLPWLLARIQKKESPISQNKQYAAEILSILTQSSTSNRRRVIEADGIDILLQCLAAYRRRDPEKESEEEEYMENLFNCLTSLVDEASGKAKFVEAEGVELCLIMLKEGKTSKPRALKVLDHACGYAEAPTLDEAKPNGTPLSKSKDKGKSKEQEDSNPNIAASVCEKLIEAAGLKPLFSTFTKTKSHSPETTEHILGILASLLRSLPGNSAPRFRLLAKFVEKDFEKIKNLVSLRRDYAARVAAFDKRLKDWKRGLSKQEQEELELENIATRLDEGLYCLEKVDVVLAWLVAEDDGAKRAIVKGLAERDEGLKDVRRTLQAQLDGVLKVEESERDMLDALVGFLS